MQIVEEIKRVTGLDSKVLHRNGSTIVEVGGDVDPALTIQDEGRALILLQALDDGWTKSKEFYPVLRHMLERAGAVVAAPKIEPGIYHMDHPVTNPISDKRVKNPMTDWTRYHTWEKGFRYKVTRDPRGRLTVKAAHDSYMGVMAEPDRDTGARERDAWYLLTSHLKPAPDDLQSLLAKYDFPRAACIQLVDRLLKASTITLTDVEAVLRAT